MTWDEVYQAEFGKQLTEDQVGAFEYSFGHHFKRWDGDEIIEAIQMLSEDRRKDGRLRKFAPTSGDIRSAIIKRKALEHGTYEKAPVQETCALCNKGMINYVPGLAIPFTLEEYVHAYAYALPCRCSAGEHQLEVQYRMPGCPPDFKGQLRDKAREAVTQAAEFERMCQTSRASSVTAEVNAQ